MIEKIKPSASKVAMSWTKKKNPPLMEPIETDLLIKYVKKCKIHFVEIGTYKGGSTSIISKYLPNDVHLTTIDIFKKASEISISQPIKEKLPTYEEAKKTIEEQGNISKVEIIKGNSWKIAKNWKRKIDILFIDGDHSYEGVKRDFSNWEPYLVRGGYILMHDVNFKGVKKFIKEILKNPRFFFKERAGQLAVIKKLN
jgi:predicted O-methyltransferase YrrM